MAEALSETLICSMALNRIGSERLNDLEHDKTPEAIACRDHYEQTRDGLLRSNWWRFARTRKTLSQDEETPEFEWSYQYSLPNEFLRLRSVYSDNNTPSKTTYYSYAIEGKKLYSNESTAEIRYIERVIDPTQFDPLFVELLVLQLAIKLVMPLTQDRLLRRELIEELAPLMSHVRVVDKQETNTRGVADMGTWLNARATYTGWWGSNPGGL